MTIFKHTPGVGAEDKAATCSSLFVAHPTLAGIPAYFRLEIREKRLRHHPMIDSYPRFEYSPIPASALMAPPHIEGLI